jgi:hypothetical protein
MPLTDLSRSHISDSQSSVFGGDSGMKTKSAPVAIPARRASQPQCLPMTSMTKAREWDEAVEEIESMASQIRWSAVRAPIVRSVIDMSLLWAPGQHSFQVKGRTIK